MLTDPNGYFWRVGDRVILDDSLTFITEIYEGNGSWEAAPKGGDIDSVWMRLGNKWMARPFLLFNLEHSKDAL